MRTYDSDQPVIFTHIPKCAGTSFVQVLRTWFGAGYHKLNQDETRDILLPRVEPLNDQGAWRPDVRCIHGHFNHGRGYGLPYYYPEITQYFTMLRDPFDLVVSMYFFVKGRSAEGKFWFRGERIDFSAQFPTLESYLQSYPYWLYHHLPQDVTLGNLEQKLAERFVYIGLVEEMEESMRSLAVVLGQPVIEVPQLNVSNYDEVVPERLRARFYRDYPLLKGVYEFAKARFRLS